MVTAWPVWEVGAENERVEPPREAKLVGAVFISMPSTSASEATLVSKTSCRLAGDPFPAGSKIKYPPTWETGIPIAAA